MTQSRRSASTEEQPRNSRGTARSPGGKTSKQASIDAESPAARRGTCALCGQGVFSNQPRSQENGAYVHESCLEGTRKKTGDSGERTVQVMNGSKAGAKDGPNIRTQRGTCAVCSKGVFSDQPRTNENGKYYHEECLRRNEEPISSPPKRPSAKKALNAREAQDPAPDTPSHRGDCAVCGEGVYSNQARSQEDGKYFHEDCLAKRSASKPMQTSSSAGGGTILAHKSPALTASRPEHNASSVLSPSKRGTCPVCGEGVYSNQARSQENGTYFHEDCLSKSQVEAKPRVIPKTPNLPSLNDIKKEEPRSATVSPSILFSEDDVDAAKARADIEAMMRELETKSAEQASRKAELAASRQKELEEVAGPDSRKVSRGSATVSDITVAGGFLEEQKQKAELENRRQEEELRKEAEKKIRNALLRDKAAAEAREKAMREESARVVADAEVRLRNNLEKQQELARREEAVRLREELILQQEESLQRLRQEAAKEAADARRTRNVGSVSSADRVEDNTSMVYEKEKQARPKVAEAQCGPDLLPRGEIDSLAHSVLEWLQNIEPETSDLLRRLAQYRSDRQTTQEDKGWVDDVSELLSMWLQTGDMFRQLTASKSRIGTSGKDGGNIAPVETHAASCAARVHESALEERCKQVCTILHHRTTQTSSLLPSLRDLVLLAETASQENRMFSSRSSKSHDVAHGISSFVAQLEYELQTVAFERAEFEETMSTMAQVADAWKAERLELRNEILRLQSHNAVKAVRSPKSHMGTSPLLSSEATIAQLEMWYKELAQVANLDEAPVDVSASSPVRSLAGTPVKQEKARTARLFVNEGTFSEVKPNEVLGKQCLEANSSGHVVGRNWGGAGERSPMAVSYGSQDVSLNTAPDRVAVGARSCWLSPQTWEPKRMTDMGLMSEFEVHQREQDEHKPSRCRLI